MAFQQGVATSPSNLLDTLGVFAAANGWTVTTGGLGGDGLGQHSFDDGAGFFVHAIAENASSRIRSQPATGLTGGGGTAFYNHPGSPNTGGTIPSTVNMAQITGPFTQYFFFAPNAAPRYIHVVLEITAGVFSHWSFGSMTKFGTFTGGGYDTALAWRNSNTNGIMIPFMMDNPTTAGTQWVRGDGQFGSVVVPDWYQDIAWGYDEGSVDGLSFVSVLYEAGLSNLTQRSPLIPIYFKASQGGGGLDQNVPLGQAQEVRLVAMEGRAGGDIITIGSDQWYIFPARIKGTGEGTSAFTIQGSQPNHDTGQMGFAYRRIN